MKKKNKKKIIVYSIFSLLIVILILVIFIKFNNKNDKNGNIENVFLKLAENSYKYYYYMFGDVSVDEGYIKIDDEIYYVVNDKNVLLLKNFQNLIYDTFIPEMQTNLLDAQDKNEYIEINNNLYVKKTSNPCKKIKELNFDNIKIEKKENSIQVYYDFTSTYMYQIDGEWKLEYNIYQCENENN